MSTPAQIEANRLNAQKSTGPKTEEGKAKVSQNSTRHGLRAHHLSMPNDFADDAEDFIAGIRRSLKPQDEAEEYCVFRIASQMWRLMRVVSTETNIIAKAMQGRHKRGVSQAFEYEAESILTLQKYETAAERSLQRNIISLKKLQHERKDEVPNERPSTVTIPEEGIDQKSGRIDSGQDQLRELRAVILEAQEKIKQIEASNVQLIEQSQFEPKSASSDINCSVPNGKNEKPKMPIKEEHPIETPFPPIPGIPEDSCLSNKIWTELRSEPLFQLITRPFTHHR